MYQLNILLLIMLCSYCGFINYMYKLDDLNINLIKFNIYKNIYEIDNITLHKNIHWNNIILNNYNIKNAETILFICGYLWIIYFSYYESWLYLTPFNKIKNILINKQLVHKHNEFEYLHLWISYYQINEQTFYNEYIDEDNIIYKISSTSSVKDDKPNFIDVIYIGYRKVKWYDHVKL